MKVQLNITRTRGVGGRISRVVEVGHELTEAEAIRDAKIQFLNEYINRDGFVGDFDNLQDAKRVAGLNVDGVVIES